MSEHRTTPAETEVGADEVRAICGDVLDWKLEAILALRPTAADVIAAVGWASGQDELGRAGRPLSGVAAQIYDLLLSDEPFQDDQ